MPDLTHVDATGAARMVDVGAKPVVAREAVAEGFVVVAAATLRAIADGQVPKGDALAVARVAGVMAAKRCDELIPLCHSLPLEAVEVTFDLPESADGPARLRIAATARTTAKTGVEMEALTAVSVAALTLYDMCKAIDKEMRIDGVRLVRKTKADPSPPPAPDKPPDPPPSPAPPPRLWTPDEDDRLRREFASGVHPDVIALAHHLPPDVVARRLAELGLTKHPNLPV